MLEEVVYTSVPRGLNPQNNGYCIVAQSKQLSAQIEQRLMQFSTYQHLADSSSTPANYSHTIFQTSSQQFHLLSRVGDGGKDYTERRCLFAHHIAETDPGQLSPAGPAWTCANKTLFYKQWNIKPGYLRPRKLPQGEFDLETCRLWNSRTGQESGAHSLAESVTQKTKKPVYVVYQSPLRLLPLFVEAVALIPVELRWQATFATYFAGSIPGIDCLWRGILKNSDLHRTAVQQSSPIIDLS